MASDSSSSSEHAWGRAFLTAGLDDSDDAVSLAKEEPLGKGNPLEEEQPLGKGQKGKAVYAAWQQERAAKQLADEALAKEETKVEDEWSGDEEKE